jgi:hypothetical protein
MPYVIPTTTVLPVMLETVLCVLVTSNDSYEDNGDYDWDNDPYATDMSLIF